MTKARTAAGYDQGYVKHVRATCLYVATKLGDLLDELVIVGGLVPTLLIDQSTHDRHVGTADLDVGMTIGMLDDEKYAELTDRLRHAGFGPDTNAAGRPTRQRWKIDGPPKVTIDFLIPPTLADDVGGKLRDLQPDFAAIIAPGLRLAFIDRQRVTLDELTIKGERAKRDIWVCGPGAFIAMKALAFRSRGENKDAYDITYFLRNYGTGVVDVAQQLATLLSEPEANEAIAMLREDFKQVGSVGPMRAAEFLFDRPDDDAQADSWGVVRDLLDLLGSTK